MKDLFFSRECRNRLVIPPRLKKRLLFMARKNVVSHVTCSFDEVMPKSHLYGRRPRVEIGANEQLAAHAIVKFGTRSRHFRINTHPSSKNYGKFLVFSSSNMIRAGKYTHAMAMRNTLVFSKWVRRMTHKRFEWFTAMSAPNMVISAKLDGPLPMEKVKAHWSATHTNKFPGIAISTSETCTPEMYKSGAFIIPGVTSVDSLNVALAAVDRVLHD